MEETPSGAAAPVAQIDTTDLASQIASFFAQNPVSSSTLMPRSAASLSSVLTQEFARAVDSLAPIPSTATVSEPTTSFSTQQATPSYDNQPLPSPSPSDTLAPLLLSNLQLPSGVAHDHPHSTTFQGPSTVATSSSLQGASSSSVPSNMLTPTTTAAGSLSIAASSATLSGEGESSQTPDNSSAIDPTFLAALPLSIRHEVLAQLRREQRVSQPAEEQQQVEPPFQSSISPEFLSALPPNIQTEVSYSIECGCSVMFKCP